MTGHDSIAAKVGSFRGHEIAQDGIEEGNRGRQESATQQHLNKSSARRRRRQRTAWASHALALRWHPFLLPNRILSFVSHKLPGVRRERPPQTTSRQGCHTLKCPGLPCREGYYFCFPISRM